MFIISIIPEILKLFFFLFVSCYKSENISLRKYVRLIGLIESYIKFKKKKKHLRRGM